MGRKELAKLRFMVVEDDPFQREILTMLLGNLGAQHILQAENGRIALNLLQDPVVAVDIMLCDLDMPEKDGMACLRELAALKRDTAVILVSGLGVAMLNSVETMAKAFGLMVLGCLQKPTSRSAMQSLLANYKTHDEKTEPHPKFRIPQQELAAAMKNGEFVPYFQPKVEMVSGRVIGVESLARWNSPSRGLLAPAAFLEEIETYGLMDHLTWIILAKSAAICRQWQEQGLPLLVSVNLSLSSLARLELAERIFEVVSKQGLAPSSLILEVTETAAMVAVGPSLENLSRLRMRGFGLSIDDYGTGYSSLQQLTRVPFTELKIDQSFVKEAIHHEATRLVIESSQEIAHKLGMKVTAEGIETPEQWAMLCAMGCDIAQGYLIAKPMPADAIPAWMSGWNLSSIQNTLPKRLAVNILLVEDEDFQRETYADLLEQLHLGRVDTAADVNEALGWLDKMAYGLVITDINLGTGNGLDLIRLIRSGQTPAPSDIRVLILTSNSEQDTVFRSITLDVQGYLTKPANSRTLLKTIEQGLAEAFTAQDPAHYFGFNASVRSAPTHPMKQHVSATILRGDDQIGPGRHRIASGQIPLLALKEGMVLAEPIYTNTDFLVLGGGKTLTSSIINRLLDLRDSLASQNVWVVT